MQEELVSTKIQLTKDCSMLGDSQKHEKLLEKTRAQRVELLDEL